MDIEILHGKRSSAPDAVVDFQIGVGPCLFTRVASLEPSLCLFCARLRLASWASRVVATFGPFVILKNRKAVMAKQKTVVVMRAALALPALAMLGMGMAVWWLGGRGKQ